ncbi:hypothetical protein OQA88_8288 [Cercophora sp. LCS_1]
MAGYNPRYGFDQGQSPFAQHTVYPLQITYPAAAAPQAQIMILPAQVMAPTPQPQTLLQLASQPPATAQPAVTIPGAALRNSTGGNGLEPGYVYLYPDQHVRVHLIITNSEPWVSGTQTDYVRLYVGANMKISELKEAAGVGDGTLVEVMEGGEGRWYKGMEVTGLEGVMGREREDMTLRELGWVGRVVWVWVER